MSEHAESSAAATILRTNDPLSQALRHGTALDIDGIARLNRIVSSGPGDLSSVGTSSIGVFSSHEESTITKPTSTGTNLLSYERRDKLKHDYASSLSGTHGSASEGDVECRALRRNNLIAIGDWADTETEHNRPLRGSARAKERQQVRRKLKYKKPVVVIEQNNRVVGQSEKGSEYMATTPHSHSTTGRLSIFQTLHFTFIDARQGKKYLRHRTLKHDVDPVELAEEGQSQPTTSYKPKIKSLSRTRTYVVVGLGAMMILTVALSAYGAYHTGKARMSCTKGIVFATTISMALFTVLAMLIVRRALSEALLAGLLEFAFGFALLVELDDFM